MAVLYIKYDSLYKNNIFLVDMYTFVTMDICVCVYHTYESVWNVFFINVIILYV